jgi:lipopolysaccharide export LptBFGC system permease protein LptF
MIDNLWNVLQAIGIVTGILIVSFMALMAVMAIVILVREWPNRD